MRTCLPFAMCLIAFSWECIGQEVMVLGTPHLTGLSSAPTEDQFAHTVEALSAFAPTQVCVERMSGERIEFLLSDPERYAANFQSTWHGRPLANVQIPLGVQWQLQLEQSPHDARREARDLVGQWDGLEIPERARAIALQLAAYEFHSAVLNWSYLATVERAEVSGTLGIGTVDALQDALNSVHEVYSLAVPLARRSGLHWLCTADSQEDETLGIQIVQQLGGAELLESAQVKASFAELNRLLETAWQPEGGPTALTTMLRFFNGEVYARRDRQLQWETLKDVDTSEGVFHRRLMFWHARTAEISAEVYRALARGPNERVILIIGSAHRAFTESELRSQPWVEVQSALPLLAPN